MYIDGKIDFEDVLAEKLFRKYWEVNWQTGNILYNFLVGALPSANPGRVGMSRTDKRGAHLFYRKG